MSVSSFPLSLKIISNKASQLLSSLCNEDTYSGHAGSQAINNGMVFFAFIESKCWAVWTTFQFLVCLFVLRCLHPLFPGASNKE